MKRRVLAFLLLSAMLLSCFGCAKYENSTIKVHLPYQAETAVGLSNKNVSYMKTLWIEAFWEPSITKTVYDYVFLYDNTTIRYSSEFGLFNDVENDRHCYITEEQRDHINSLLKSAFK